MDDFEFLLPEDDPIMEHHEHEEEVGHTPPFQHLATLPTHQLPKTVIPNRGITTTLGGSIRELVMSRNAWGPKLNLPQSKPQETPLLTSAGNPAEQPPVLGSREASQENARPQEKYVWMPTRRPPAVWSESDTQLFFDGIAQFGTDLSSIAVLFPGRTRQDIAHKFRVESTKRPNHMQSALLVQNQRPVDVEKFKEAKKKCDELKAEPVRVLDADEQEALNQLLGTLEQTPAAVQQRVEVKVKEDPDGPQFPPVVPSFASKAPPEDFNFDDEDAPITSFYTSKGREQTAGSVKPVVKRARSPAASSLVKPKRTSGPSPAPKRGTVKPDPATQAAQPVQPTPKATEDFEFDEEDHMMTFEEAAGITASQDDDNDLVFDQHDFRNAVATDNDRDEDFGFL